MKFIFTHSDGHQATVSSLSKASARTKLQHCLNHLSIQSTAEYICDLRLNPVFPPAETWECDTPWENPNRLEDPLLWEALQKLKWDSLLDFNRINSDLRQMPRKQADLLFSFATRKVDTLYLVLSDHQVQEDTPLPKRKNDLEIAALNFDLWNLIGAGLRQYEDAFNHPGIIEKKWRMSHYIKPDFLQRFSFQNCFLQALGLTID
jgi:hypothetical protein